VANTVIQLKFSTVASNTPSELANGELAINSADGKLYYRTPSGSITYLNATYPAGLTTEVQFNDAGSIGSNSGFTFSKSSQLLTVTGSANIGGMNIVPTITSAYAFANTVNIKTDAAFTKANSANILAQAAYDFANTLSGGTSSDGFARATANAAFDKANSANIFAQAAFNQANSEPIGSAAFTKANSANILAQAAFDYANTSGGTYATAAFAKANAANVLAQSAYNNSNTKFASAGGTISGDVTLTGNLIPTTDNVYYLGSTTKRWRSIFVGANSIDVGGIVISNSGGSASLSGATDFALPDSPVPSLGTLSNTANAAFAQANAANVLAQASYTWGNTVNIFTQSAFTKANTANTTAEAAYAWANTVNIFTQSAYAKANAANVLAQAAFDNSNTKFATAGGTITGNVTISNGRDLTVTGNLYVQGNTVSLNTSTLDVVDALITLGSGNYTTDILDIGFAAHYNAGTNAHTGLIRDYGTKEWYFFKGYTPELSGNNNINLNDASFATDNVNANFFKGNLIGSTVVTTGNVSANYFVGNGSALTGIARASYADSVANGTSNVNIVTANGNVTIAVGGVSPIVTIANTGIITTGNVTANYFSGNGSLLTGVARASYADSVANGTSNVNIVTANGNVTIAVAGVSPVVTIANTGLFTSNLISSGYIQFADGTKQYTANAGSGSGSGTANTSGWLANSVIFANATGYLSNTNNLQFFSSNNVLQVTTLTTVGTSGNITNVNYISANGITTTGSSGNISGVNFVYSNVHVANTGGYFQFADGTKQYTANADSGAYAFANTVNIKVDSAYAFANIANIKVDSAYAFANTVNIKTDSAYAFANTVNIKTDAAFTRANTANTTADAAFSKANVANTIAQGGYDKANAANVLAQAAFNAANSSSGSAAAFDFANTVNVKVDSAYAFANTVNVKVDSAYAFANTVNIKTDAAFTKANSANVLAQAAFNAANSAGGSASQAAFDKANSANVLAQAAFDKANTGGGGGGSSVSISDAPPTSPTANSLWWQSNTGILKIYYTDADSSQWVDASPPSGGSSTTDVLSPFLLMGA